MSKHTDINPKHYAGIVNGQPVEVADIIEAFFVDDAHLSQAVKYLLRAGRKDKSSYLEDVGKCLWWCAKAIMYHGGVVELPPKCKPSFQTRTVRKPPKPVRERKTRGTHK